MKFYIGRELIKTDSTAPYICILRTDAYDGAYTIRAEAVDTCGQLSADDVSILIKHTYENY